MTVPEIWTTLSEMGPGALGAAAFLELLAILFLVRANSKQSDTIDKLADQYRAIQELRVTEARGAVSAIETNKAVMEGMGNAMVALQGGVGQLERTVIRLDAAQSAKGKRE
jgi:hypothetical protein